MLRRPESAATAWQRGPFRVRRQQIAFGQTYEDAAVELRALRPSSRVFAIAGAGHTARILAAAGHPVTAVDIDAQQVAYAEGRVAGAPARMGRAERVLAMGRHFAALAGWSPGRIAEFLSLSDCGQQVEYWDRWLDTRRWRAAVDALLSPSVLSLCYAGAFVQAVPREFGEKVRRRLRRCWARHPNRSNPYAAALLTGTPIAEPGPPVNPIQFVCADAAEFLERSPAGIFDGFALSNIGDGASPEYMCRLQHAIEHAAAPEAVVVSRTFAEPDLESTTNWAALDRSMLWGVVDVRPVASFFKGGQLCSPG